MVAMLARCCSHTRHLLKSLLQGLKIDTHACTNTAECQS